MGRQPTRASTSLCGGFAPRFRSEQPLDLIEQQLEIKWIQCIARCWSSRIRPINQATLAAAFQTAAAAGSAARLLGYCDRCNKRTAHGCCSAEPSSSHNPLDDRLARTPTQEATHLDLTTLSLPRIS